MVNEFGLVDRGHDIIITAADEEKEEGAGFIVASKYAAKGEAVDVVCRPVRCSYLKRKKLKHKRSMTQMTAYYFQVTWIPISLNILFSSKMSDQQSLK